ncbi:hypothetical protein Q6316_26585, partial [Klebsiella pneumoniae]|uniref:hypothetical protein n=1 Tax=Klebsiella pneumoniae TaxID=573 RepID=UPI00272F3461
KRAYCLKTQPATGETYPKSDLFNKAALREEAARKGLSIPALVNAIVKNTILQTEEPNAKKEKTRT